MCGISGVTFPRDSGCRPDPAAMESMRDVLRHRGPDDAGLFLDEGVALGHRRLSIVDVDRGHQPMASDDGRFRIVYNGEIYNHPELMADLEREGVLYRTHCDTETVLRLFEREGPGLVNFLRGMFAFAIWDRRKRELFLARDRFGIKPLYYVHTSEGTLYFASEIKALFKAGAVKPKLNRKALPDFLANHATSGAETLFAGVRRLPPGHVLLWRDGAVKLQRYWEPPIGEAEQDYRSDGSLVEEYGERFRQAVRLHLMADVPLGVFLSGGIDSAAITAVMSDLGVGQVKTFSMGFAEREANELAYARLVADRYETDHHEVVVTPEQFWNAVPRLVWHEDEPMAHPSSVALNFVARLAAKHVKVVLTGEGSDETLAGYNRYRVTLMNMAMGSWYHRLTVGGLRAHIRRTIDALPMSARTRRRLARTFLMLPPNLDALYLDNFAVFPSTLQTRLLAPEVRESVSAIDPYSVAHEVLARRNDGSLLDSLLHAEVLTYLQELLMKQDQMSMAASIESRVPFLDHPLAEFALGLPQRLRLRGLTTKVVLRRTMKGLLPPEILARRKMGFPVPVGSWLRGRYQHLLDDYVLGERAVARKLFDPTVVRQLVVRHLAGEPGHDEQLWTLINLEVWHRIFVDREMVEDISPAEAVAVKRSA